MQARDRAAQRIEAIVRQGSLGGTNAENFGTQHRLARLIRLAGLRLGKAHRRPVGCEPALIPINQCQEVGRADEIRRETTDRAPIQRARFTLFDDASGFHDDDSIGHRKRLGLIMSHVDRGDRQLLLNAADLGARSIAEPGIEIRQWLVEQQHFGTADDRARQRDTLLLAAGKLRRVTFGQCAQANDVERPPHRLGGVARAAHRERKGYVLLHRHVRPNGVGLEYHAQVSFVRRHEDIPLAVANDLAIDLYDAAVRAFKTRNATQGRGLAASARAEQRDEFTVAHREGNTMHDGGRAIGLDELRDAYAHRSAIAGSWRWS